MMKFLGSLFIATFFFTVFSAAHGQNLYWDIDTNSDPGSGGGGAPSGTWDVGTTPNWNVNSDGSGIPGTWTDGNTAVFSAGATGSNYTVTTTAPVSATGVTFQDNGVTLAATGTGQLTLTGAAGVNFTNAGFVGRISAPIAGAAGLTLTPTTGTTAGVLELMGVNTYSGATTVNAGGSLNLGVAGAVPSSTVLTTVGGSINIRLSFTSTLDSQVFGADQTVASLSGAGGTVTLGTQTLTIANPNGETFGGTFVTSAGGKVVKDGTGSLRLDGQSGNFTGGELQLKKGTLLIGAVNAIGTYANAGTLKINPDGNTGANAPTIQNGGNFTMSTKFIEVYGNFTVDLQAAGSLQFLGGPVTSPTEWAHDTVTLKTANPEITVSNTAGTGVLILNSYITDNFGTEGQARGFTKKGAGVLSLQNTGNKPGVTSDYKGDVTIMEGTLRLVHQTTGLTNTTNRNNARALETAGMLAQVQSGIGDGTGTLRLAGGKLVFTGAVMGAFASVEGGAVDLHVNDPRLMPILNPIDVTGDAAVAYEAGTQTPATDVTFQFTNNSFSGTAGTLTFSRSSATNNTYRPTFTGSGFNFSRPVVISHDPTDTGGTPRKTVLTSANTSGTQTWSGNMSGNGGFRRETAGGTTILTGANTYTGGTVVDGGTLTATGSTATFGSGDLSVNAGNASISAGVANAILDTAKLTLLGGGTASVADVGFIALAAGINERVGSLVLGTTTYTAGTFGSLASAATFKDDEYFTGTGIISVGPAGIPGDFNSDGKVDAGDYATWRKNDGTNNALANDNNLGTPVGVAHYNLWRANFGNPPGAGAGGLGAGAVPEPGTIWLLIFAIGSALVTCNRDFRRSKN